MATFINPERFGITPNQIVRISKQEKDKHEQVRVIIRSQVSNKDLETFLDNNTITEFELKGDTMNLVFKGGRRLRITINPLEIKFV